MLCVQLYVRRASHGSHTVLANHERFEMQSAERASGCSFLFLLVNFAVQQTIFSEYCIGAQRFECAKIQSALTAGSCFQCRFVAHSP